MRVRRRIKKSTKQYVAVSISMILILGGAFSFLLIHATRQIKATYEVSLKEKEAYISENTRTTYCTGTDIKAGEFITIDKLAHMTVLDSQNEEAFMTEDDIGRTALISIPAGTPVTKAMVNHQVMSSDQREVVYQSIFVGQNIVENDVVDIRINYPNGEDYLIVTKKPIHNLDDGTSCCFWLNEEELLLMRSALVDIYLFQGGSIYTTKYIEPTIQDSLQPNYIPSEEVCDVISNDPNITKIASEYLSERLRNELEERQEKADTIDSSVGYYERGEYFGYE